MKLDRLMGILAVLQSKDRVTAPYLAKKFEVSRRTINRDIEELCKAGIPIVTIQGSNGGISVMDGYKIDKSILTSEELQSILIGLKSMDSISPTPHADRILDKLSSEKNRLLPLADSIYIDLSAGFYKESLSNKITLLRKAIAQYKLVTFCYYYAKGESEKQVEPYLIVYQWSAWYLFGFCPERNDYRMYKLNRLWKLQIMEANFFPKEIPGDKMNFFAFLENGKPIRAEFDEAVKYRLVEAYGPNCFTNLGNGKLLFEWDYSKADHMLSWLLSFGGSVRVLEPPEIRQELKREAERMLSHYQKEEA